MWTAGETDDFDPVVFVNSLNLAVIEFVNFDFGAGGRQQAYARFRIPAICGFLSFDEVPRSMFRASTRRSVNDERLDASSRPASNPNVWEIADVIGV